MDITPETARERLAEWAQDAAELVLFFKGAGFGNSGKEIGGAVGGRLESVEGNHAVFEIKPAPGFIWVRLVECAFEEAPESIIIKYPEGGDCKLLRRTINDWPEVVGEYQEDMV